jgi:hypothetical protein
VHAFKLHARLLGKQCRADDRAAYLSQGKWVDMWRCARANLNKSAEAWALYCGDSFLGVIGVQCFKGYQHPWWMLTLEAEDPKFFLAARALVESFRDRYPLLLASVRASDAKATSALEALGFAILAPAKFGESPDLWCKAVLDTRHIEVAHA